MKHRSSFVHASLGLVVIACTTWEIPQKADGGDNSDAGVAGSTNSGGMSGMAGAAEAAGAAGVAGATRGGAPNMGGAAGTPRPPSAGGAANTPPPAVAGAAGMMAGGGAPISGGAGGASAAGAAAAAGAGGGTFVDRGTTIAQWLTRAATQVPRSTGAFSYSDGTSTMLLTTTGGGRVCMSGVAAADDKDYSQWGALMGIRLARQAQGGALIGFDATALGARQVRVTLTGVPAVGIRVSLAMVNQGEKRFQEQPFIFRGAPLGDVKIDRTASMAIGLFRQPEWGLVGEILNPSLLYALQFQVNTTQGVDTPYDFCVSDITWLDVNGMVIPVP